MQIYTLSEPIYGPENYTSVEKKIDTSVVNEPEKVLEGAGLLDEDEKPTPSEKLENVNVKETREDNETLNQLNLKSKERLDTDIYKSFLHPNLNKIKTGSISVGVGAKRKISPPTETAHSIETKKKSSGENTKVKHKFHLI